jgi:hypothetical protein
MTDSDNIAAELDVANTRIKLETGQSFCTQNTCPTIYETSDEGWVAVQGYRHHDSTVGEHTPDGEDVVLVDRAPLASVFGCHH